jgi:phosphate transport system substrate-binding protein
MNQSRNKSHLTNDAILADLLWKLRLRVLAYNGESIDIRELRKDANYRNKWLDIASSCGDMELERLAQSIRQRVAFLCQENDVYHTVNTIRAEEDDDNAAMNKVPWLVAAVAVLASMALFLLQGPITPKSGELALAKHSEESPHSTSSTSHSPELIMRLHGSNTIGEKLAPALVFDYLRSIGATNIKLVKTGVAVENDIIADLEKRQVRVEIHAHGSSTGFQDLASNTTDIAMASRKIKTKEVDALAPMYGDLTRSSAEYILALDGLAIITHPAIPFDKLEASVISRLFSGDIKNWNEIGGPDFPVSVFARDGNSGSWDSFKSMILKPTKRQLTIEAKRYESSQELSDKVAVTPGAIGFIGLPYVRRSKVIAVAADASSLPVYPTTFTVGTEDYPLSRRLYFYLPANSENVFAHQFVEFAVANEGQKTVENSGLVSQNILASKPNPTPDMPASYLAMTKYAQRLSLNFRFEPGSDNLDNKGHRDMKRMVGFLQKHPDRHVMLLGFTDSVGDPQVNLNLSQSRAELVSRELMMRGIIPAQVKGFGEGVPLASNATVQGRHRNRRVEVWVK